MPTHDGCENKSVNFRPGERHSTSWYYINIRLPVDIPHYLIW